MSQRRITGSIIALVLLGSGLAVALPPTVPVVADALRTSTGSVAVSSTPPTDGQLLKYVSASSAWQPATIAGAALSNPVTIAQGGRNSSTALSNGYAIVSTGGAIVEAKSANASAGVTTVNGPALASQGSYWSGIAMPAKFSWVPIPLSATTFDFSMQFNGSEVLGIDYITSPPVLEFSVGGNALLAFASGNIDATRVSMYFDTAVAHAGTGQPIYEFDNAGATLLQIADNGAGKASLLNLAPIPVAEGGTGVASLASLTAGTGLSYSAGGPFTAATAGTLGLSAVAYETTTTVQTTDDTQTTILTYAVPTGKTVTFRYVINGQRDDATEAMLVSNWAGARNNAGTATAYTSFADPGFKSQDDFSWNVIGPNASAGNILVKVQGAVGKTVNWKCVFQAYAVTP